MSHRSLLTALSLVLTLALPASAQIAGLRLAPKNTVSVFGSLFTTVDGIYDPDSGSSWSFSDNAFGAGAGLHRQIVSGFQLGVEGSWARADYERVANGLLVAEGAADLFTGRATARLQTVRTGISGYLMGGIGFFGYRIEDLETTAWDLSLGYGAGVEYRFTSQNGIFLEWDRIWAYHESDDIDGNDTGRHTLLRLGLRRGF